MLDPTTIKRGGSVGVMRVPTAAVAIQADRARVSWLFGFLIPLYLEAGGSRTCFSFTSAFAEMSNEVDASLG